MGTENKYPSISVQIITLNEANNIANCLVSVRKQNPSEILVIDGGSIDSTVEIAAGLDVNVKHAPGVGRGGSRAIGYETTDCDLVAMVDADDILPADWLNDLARELEEGNYSALQGSLRVNQPSSFWERGWNQYFIESIRPTKDSNMVGHPALYVRDALLSVSRGIGHDHEDTELSVLFEQKGLRQGISAVVSYRAVPSSWRENRVKWIAYGRGYRSLVQRYPHKRSAIVRHLLWTIPIARGWRPVIRGQFLQPVFTTLMGSLILWGFLTP